jgi:hypothetical protein
VRAGEQHAPHVIGDVAHRLADPVEDRVVERVAPGRVGDRQAQDAVRRPVDEDLAADGREM